MLLNITLRIEQEEGTMSEGSAAITGRILKFGRA